MISTKKELDDFFYRETKSIHHFIDEQMARLPIPLYSSVDIRESVLRYAPVDHNMYPAGFNNLCTQDLILAKKNFDQQLPVDGLIGILIESHTKNKFYVDHLMALQQSIGADRVAFVTFDPSMPETLVGTDERTIHVHQAKVCEHFVEVRQEKIAYLILNHDQSMPIATAFNQIQTPMGPPWFMGWNWRSKIKHFECYHQVVQLFCHQFQLDEHLIEAKFDGIEGVHFDTLEGIDRLIKQTDHFLKQLPPQSTVFIKSAKGTYGMGIMSVKDAKELEHLNRRDRNKMDIVKNQLKNNSLLLQEGIETMITSEGAPAEVTVYLVSGKSVGGFLRINSEKSAMSNLNSRGMIFKKLCKNDIIKDAHEFKLKETAYSILARLSVWASAIETNQLKKELSL